LTYLDRLRDLVYTSPSGATFRPSWSSVERSGGRKVSVTELPLREFPDVQDLGTSARKYPLTVYFDGSAYDETADAFARALAERGRASLSHPRWGDLSVICIAWSQTESFVDGMGRAAFTLDLVEAPEPQALTASTDTAAAIQAAADSAATTTTSETSAGQIVAKNAPTLAKIKANVLRGVRSIRTGIASIVGVVDSVRREIDEAATEIEATIDTLILDPLVLAQSVVGLARLPALAVAGTKAKVAGYSNIISDLASRFSKTESGPAAADALTLSSTLTALLESASTGDLSSRDDAVTTAELASAAYAQALAALMSAERDSGLYLDPALLQALAELEARGSRYLLTSAYSLPVGRTLVLEGERTPLDLAAELYGSPESLDRLIADNGLSGDALLVIPRGTEIRYYA
jgi:prophage DNA circulation protein